MGIEQDIQQPNFRNEFQKMGIKPGESKEVTFRITPEELKFYNSNLEYDWEGGAFNVFIGTNSADNKKATFNWEK